jgi:hypothetical protein
MVLGSRIRDPKSGIRKKPIPDPGSRGQKAPNPGSRIRIRNTGCLFLISKIATKVCNFLPLVREHSFYRHKLDNECEYGNLLSF